MTEKVAGWCSACGETRIVDKEGDLIGMTHRDGCAYAIARSRRKVDEYVHKFGSPLMTRPQSQREKDAVPK